MADRRGYSQTGIDLLNAELAKRGIGPAAASGAIAGIMGESGANLDPTSFNSKDPGGGSGGIGQWNRGRLIGPSGMLAFAQNAGVPVNVNNPLDAKKVPLAIQAQYLGHELDTTYAGVRNQLQTANSPQDALNVWVNSYEDPADKAGAIKQRSQYLTPVSAALNAPAAAAPGPIDPSIIARGGYSPPIPGTMINTPPTAPASVASALAGIGAQASDKNFTQSAQALDKAWHGDQTPGEDEGAKAAAFNFLPARNVSPLLPMASQVYGNTLTSMATPLQWGSQSPGQAPYANAGGQPVGQQFGTSLASLQQMRQQMAMMGSPYGNPFGDSGYG